MHNASGIRRILKDNGLSVNKALGQNFLVHAGKRDEIISLCGICRHETVLEIGPGLGALTEGIQPMCANMIAVEKDRGFSDFLKRYFADSGNIEIVNSDILRYKIPDFGEKVKVVGNLPYYITSAVIFHMLCQKSRIGSMFFTVQKEVADRITAGPACKDYGMLTIGISYHCTAKKLCKIGRGSFFPAPAVDSALIELNVRQCPAVHVASEEYFFKLIKAGFNKRRKTLYNALECAPGLGLDRAAIMDAFSLLKINPRVRAEELGLEEMAKLSEALSPHSRTDKPRGPEF
ncbi:MAG: 16S rRNA (adenine(1518)-N(6)/adenine(1519)-N(6))-dimethyltransferase RsmA [Candidatus Omnitrophica bacterium]|nr:16S rRNA (adenine(1518)-N(6)/adenine(1519)-N(6))-dimethyltransferase RsmA [Candidatus Omnitrophota bacterium]